MGSVTSGTRENWNAGVGTVTVSGFSGYHGDGAIIAISSGKSSSGVIYRGAYNSSSYSSVLGMWSRRAQSGDQYCTGASYSGEICGWTVDAGQLNITYSTGEVARNIVRSRNKQGWCTRPGDSGGSIFTATSSGVTAKGVHSAGSGVRRVTRQ
jgi:streptogrisin C